MTQEQLEAVSGVRQPLISGLEVGRYKWDALASGTLFALCHALECNPVWLVTGTGEKDLSGIDPMLVQLIKAADGLNNKAIEALVATANAMRVK